MLAWIRSEVPAVIGLLQVGLALGVAFGLNLTSVQIGAIMAFAAAAGALVTRANVSPAVKS